MKIRAFVLLATTSRLAACNGSPMSVSYDLGSSSLDLAGQRGLDLSTSGDSRGRSLLMAAAPIRILAGPVSSCVETSKVIYAVDMFAHLYKFDPVSFAFTMVGPLDCNGNEGSLAAFALDRNGDGWLSFTDGNLYKVNVSTAACSTTAYDPKANTLQKGWDLFGMGTAWDDAGRTSDTLYVSSSAGQLGKIDRTNFTLSLIGTYGSTWDGTANLTGTGDGRLFGFDVDFSPAQFAEIDKSTES